MSIRTYEFNGYKYSYDEESRDFGISGCNEQCPTTLFKYYPLNKNSVDALTNLYIFATHPYLLNDPFDCDRQLVEFDDIESVKYLFEHFYEQFAAIYEGQIFEFASMVFWTIYYRKCGIISLTENANDQLMWSLYAQNSGFCVEFDYTKFPFRTYGPFHINYTDEISPIHTREVGLPLAALYQCNVKHKCWEREKEWRIMVSNPVGFDMKTYGANANSFNCPCDHDRKFKYPLDAIKSITLGSKFLDEETETIVQPYPTEIECVVVDNLKIAVLNFLSNPKVNIPVRLAIKDNLNAFDYVSINVMALSNNKFRIYEV